MRAYNYVKHLVEKYTKREVFLDEFSVNFLKQKFYKHYAKFAENKIRGLHISQRCFTL